MLELKTLRLDTGRTWVSPSRLTIGDLQVLTHRCPHLRTLAIVVDAAIHQYISLTQYSSPLSSHRRQRFIHINSYPIQANHLLDVDQIPSLRHLLVGCSRIRSHPQVHAQIAASLGSMFPKLKRISASWSSDGSADLQSTEGWCQVEKLLMQNPSHIKWWRGTESTVQSSLSQEGVGGRIF